MNDLVFARGLSMTKASYIRNDLGVLKGTEVLQKKADDLCVLWNKVMTGKT